MQPERSIHEHAGDATIGRKGPAFGESSAAVNSLRLFDLPDTAKPDAYYLSAWQSGTIMACHGYLGAFQ
jgi:hypothetical protein